MGRREERAMIVCENVRDGLCMKRTDENDDRGRTGEGECCFCVDIGGRGAVMWCVGKVIRCENETQRVQCEELR
jgi:hypothetical protein